MLLQFVCENVLSFREKAILSMTPAPHVDHRGGQVFQGQALRCGVLYGANASGKSNLVKAMRMATRLVLNDTQPQSRIAVVPFKLDPECLAAPSGFQFDFLVGEDRYSYGFAADAEKVHEEWLSCHDEDLFTRSVDGTSTFEFGSFLKTGERAQFVDFVAQGTRPNQLFLREAAQRNVHELAPVLDWFAKSLDFVGPRHEVEGLATLLYKNPELTDFVGGFLKASGTGVECIGIESIVVEERSPETRYDSETQSMLEIITRFLADFERGRLDSNAHKVLTRRVGAVDNLIDFELDEESDGTRRLLNLIVALFNPKASKGRVVIADELDRSLHPLLTQYLLRFHIDSDDGAPTQLICTSHDTNLLDLNSLSSDSIWFVEKDSQGNSALHSLADYKGEQLDRLTGNIEKGYLQGRFGAIPFLANPQKLNWPKAGGCVEEVSADQTS